MRPVHITALLLSLLPILVNAGPIPTAAPPTITVSDGTSTVEVVLPEGIVLPSSVASDVKMSTGPGPMIPNQMQPVEE